MISEAARDLRYGLRLLARSPAFTAAVLVVLALAIGANTAIFSVVNAVLLHPLPYRDPERLVAVSQRMEGGAGNLFSTPNFLAWRGDRGLFEAFGASIPLGFNLSDGGVTEHVAGANVTAGYFELLGLRPMLGRTFLPEEERAGGERVVVLSYGLWRREFGGDRSIVGRRLRVDGASATVVGVMPCFQPPQGEQEMWAPLQLNPAEIGGESGGLHWIAGLARLRTGLTLDQTRARANAAARRLGQEYPRSGAGLGVVLTPLIEHIAGDVKPSLYVLLGAVGLMLLAACANVANLMLARAAARRKEMVIRAALGAERGRLMAQVFAESLLLALGGGALGLPLAVWGVHALVALVPAGSIPRMEEIGVDGRALGFSFAVTLATALLCGLAPSLQAAGRDIHEALKQTGRGAEHGVGRTRLRGVLVVAEVAVTLMLTIGAGLLARSFWELRTVKPGFDGDGVMTLRIPLPANLSAERMKALAERLVVRIRSVPGVETAAATRDLPMSGVDPSLPFTIAGRPAPERGKEPVARWRAASPGYFRTMGVPMKSGREFSEGDTANSPCVAIISETMAKRFWPEENATGKRIRPGYPGDPPLCEIVGVVGDVRQWLAYEEPPVAYYAYSQIPASSMPAMGWITLVARARRDAAGAAAEMRTEIGRVDKDLPAARVVSMQELLHEASGAVRFETLLLAIFSALALSLAAVGVYGVISYAVARREREIGIRIALGAERGDVIRLVLRQGSVFTLAGVGIGLAGAAALTRALASLLYGVKPWDAATFAGVAGLMACVSLAASYFPARRAARVDPATALRSE